MAEPNWGRKRVCLECQAPFYDMRRAPITCPKCGATHQPVALLKSAGRPPRRNRLRPTLTTPQAAEPQPEPTASSDPEISESDEPAEVLVDDVGDMDDREMERVGDEPGR
jgi:uncharacterized protein (TIGR02300 family)